MKGNAGERAPNTRDPQGRGVKGRGLGGELGGKAWALKQVLKLGHGDIVAQEAGPSKGNLGAPPSLHWDGPIQLIALLPRTRGVQGKQRSGRAACAGGGQGHAPGVVKPLRQELRAGEAAGGVEEAHSVHLSPIVLGIQSTKVPAKGALEGRAGPTTQLAKVCDTPRDII